MPHVTRMSGWGVEGNRCGCRCMMHSAGWGPVLYHCLAWVAGSSKARKPMQNATQARVTSTPRRTPGSYTDPYMLGSGSYHVRNKQTNKQSGEQGA